MKNILLIFSLALVLFGLIACGGGSSAGSAGQAQNIPVSISVDSKLAASIQTQSLEAIDGSDTSRPVALMRDEDGNDAEFVENELIITTGDQVALNAFIKRWDGQLLKTIDMKAADIIGMDNMYLVRINTSLADTAQLNNDLQALQPEVGGDVTVSSEAALGLLAANSSESLRGLSVGFNWIGQGTSIASGSAMEEASDTLNGISFGANAFDWNYMNAGSIQDIGVTEAWKLLDRQGKLTKWIKLAILDMGFDPDTNGDIDPDYIAFSNVPRKSAIGSANLSNCTGGSPCPWHGTGVANAAMALVGNMNGVAGPAGPVAKPVLIYTRYDFITGIAAIIEAKVAGAKIINMSYRTVVPAIVSFTVLPFNAFTRQARASGVLLFAAAGNENKNVDKRRCILNVCWEKRWYTPCENSGVICVGGLAYNSKNRADYGSNGSNYGKKNVDIYGPYVVVTGPDRSPQKPVGSSYVTYGTSTASPFVAGVAALIWTANHSLSADQVADIMMRTAHTSPDDKVDRYINAQAAVREALGTSIHISEPLTGASITRGRPVTFIAVANSAEHNNPVISWSSDVQGDLGTGSTITRNDLILGTHVVTATVIYEDGFSKIDRVTVTIVNLVPVVTIDEPSGSIYRYPYSSNIVLHGSSFDGDAAPDFRLQDSQVHWMLNEIEVGTGHNPAPFSASSIGLPVGGPYILKFEGTDGVATVSDTFDSIFIGTDSSNLRPNVQILTPAANTSVIAVQDPVTGEWYKEFGLTWDVNDPEDGVLPYTSLKWYDRINSTVSLTDPFTRIYPDVTTLTLPGGVTTKIYSVKLSVPVGLVSAVHDLRLIARDSQGGFNSTVNKIVVTVLY